MDIYLVGGAVRDQLLNRKVFDRDWVVVGASVNDMLTQGYLPVGKDFPVFLHPKTHEEYALARTERKTSAGYTGFTVHADPSVTLEEDLARRDLTINAMAQAQDGSLIDPYGGQADLQQGLLRHVSDAFVEDPVRILRIARFAARYGFSVAPETQALMQAMVHSGEVNALVAERVWQELAKALMEPKPELFFETLRQCGALAVLMPEVDALWGVPQRADYHPEVDTGIHTMMVLQQAVQQGLDLPQRFAALTHDLGKAKTPAHILPRHHGHDHGGLAPLAELAKRLRVPNDCYELAQMTVREHILIHSVNELKAKTVLTLLMRCDVVRRPERFKAMLAVCQADAQGRLGLEQQPYPQRAQWTSYVDAILAVDAGAIAQACPDKSLIPERIAAARLKALQALHSKG
ncbi:multifunctional CCA addition/repair protein [Neisseriaceae bacterium CLB008]|nr:multifunctional CCA addition/repair protein [Neisseriaceae bacterium]